MEDILTYIIIFGLLILFAIVFLSKNEKKKEFLLTKKDYSFGSLKVLIEKQGKEIRFLIIETLLNTPNQYPPLTLSVEAVLKDRSTLLIELSNELFTSSEAYRYKVDYNELYKLITTRCNRLQHFRLVATFTDNKKLKSGILAFNKKWNIITPDTGTYN
ncbi:MAG: hypothetical protein DRJ09_01400 [Bacteroidetes bacterium]|nr:MAG: hypothetical protein DRJ09_01400 [Bacteroidota bacterium]